jgi:glycosyltransferase involved in cell wall biosynthesis
MEFMQAGKCIITTNNGAQPEYITSGENGILIPSDNLEELSKAISDALENSDYRKKLGKEAELYFNGKLNYREFIKNILWCYE